ncbi:hypothetical protein EVAR_18119_1 [Eumeta japonica]|uniref:Uncharacterized protein n=1 Tax=Eumeta variegata TaxID=151549 RepID=A0A4C1VI24_EUMVA|nr:hypothetical protein EVAR_18119_1 [Eumeta japonica]
MMQRFAAGDSNAIYDIVTAHHERELIQKEALVPGTAPTWSSSGQRPGLYGEFRVVHDELLRGHGPSPEQPGQALSLSVILAGSGGLHQSTARRSLRVVLFTRARTRYRYLFLKTTWAASALEHSGRRRPRS